MIELDCNHEWVVKGVSYEFKVKYKFSWCMEYYKYG